MSPGYTASEYGDRPGHEIEVTFKVKVKVDVALPEVAVSQALIWAQRLCDVGIFEDASEDGTCTPKITCTGGEVEDVEVV